MGELAGELRPLEAGPPPAESPEAERLADVLTALETYVEALAQGRTNSARITSYNVCYTKLLRA